MKIISKLKDKLEIKKFDFKPEIKKGYIDKIENAVFYTIDGIGDVIVASPIIREIMDNCTGTVYFICSPASKLYVDILQNKYRNIVVILIGKKENITESDIDRIAYDIKSSGRIDVVVNGLGRVTSLFARLAYQIKPRAVLSVMESAKKINKPKMLHNSVDYANMLYRQGISIVDCWGIVAQMIGGNYNRKLLFPISEYCPVATPYIAISLTGASWGSISEDNAIKICQVILRHYSGNICLLVAPGIEALCQSVASALDNVFVPEQPPSLELSGAYIKHAQALIAICSAPVHIAGAFDTPVLVLRGVERSEWRPVVSHSVEYITNDKTINGIDAPKFEKCFLKLMSSL